jgi:hypothetical protein
MTLRTRVFIPTSVRLAASCAALAFAVACSGNSPTSPSRGGASNGAVIEGTVTGAAGASVSSFRTSAYTAAATPSAAAPAGLRVRVVGTDLSTMVGEGGAFRLTEVPGGTVRLQFQNDSVNVTTELPNVSGDQIIQLEVQVSATSAVIVNEVREGKVNLCHAEGNGTYHSISVSESSEATHREQHGDGEVGDPVPGRPFMTFAEDCSLEGPAVDIEKSTNGEDADNAPGPEVEVGKPVQWAYRVSNTGTINLTSIVVTDDKGVSVDCKGQTTLAPKASMTCTGAGVATLGQYRNLGTVVASWTSATASGTVTDSDASHYLGVSPDDEDGAKITLCHKTGTDKYVKVNVSVSAEPAHRAHGDAEVGEPVPGATGKVFSASCSVQ